MMMEYIFDARLEPDPEGGFVVTFPDVPEAITAGETREEALANATEALGLALRGIASLTSSLPKRGRHRGLVPVAVEAADALKLALIEAFRQSGLTKTEFGRRLGKTETEARRILDPDHATKIATMQAALSSLGKSVVISVRSAA
jgi:antitoxin HicB